MTDFERMRVLIRQEERYRWAVEKQMAKASKMTTSFSQAGRSGSSKNGSRTEEGAIMLAALQDEYKEIMEELTAARAELQESIGKIRNAKARLEKTCLRMRYIQGMSIRRIALSLNYTEDYLHRKMRGAEALIINIQKEQEKKNNKTVQVG